MNALRKGGVLLTGVAIFALTGAAATTESSNDATRYNAKTTTSDTRFAREAESGGLAEVEMGQLAVAKATNPQVKQFGQRMIDDHMKADNELKNIASKDDISLPRGLTAHDRLIYDNLSKLSGTSFNHAYMFDMLKDHQADVNEFQMEASNGMNSDLKSFAGTTLPTLQEHLRMARETNNSLPGSR